jgi:hypothetical protein
MILPARFSTEELRAKSAKDRISAVAVQDNGYRQDYKGFKNMYLWLAGE